jgi:hypothetical protein
MLDPRRARVHTNAPEVRVGVSGPMGMENPTWPGAHVSLAGE